MPEPRQGERAIILHEKDNVATALENLAKGTTVAFSGHGRSVTLVDDIPFGHKFALQDVQPGGFIVKYGAPIGKLTRPVHAGEHVHLHNLITLQRGEAGV